MSGQAERFIVVGAILGGVFLLALTLVAGAVYKGLAMRMVERRGNLAELRGEAATTDQNNDG